MTVNEFKEAVQLAEWINDGRVADWSVSLDGVKQLAKALEHCDSIVRAQNALLDMRFPARAVSPTEINNPDPGGLY